MDYLPFVLYYVPMPVQVNSVFFHRCGPDWFWDTEKVNWRDLVLWYVCRGRGTMRTAGGEYDLLPGRIFLLNSRDRYIAAHDRLRPLRVQAVHFDYEERPDPPAFFTALLPDPALTDSLFDRIHHYHSRGRGEKAAYWVEVLLEEISHTRENLESSGYQQRKIDELAEAIRRDPAQRWTLEKMAEQLHISRNHLSRIFRNTRGESPIAFVIARRIEMAKQLLLFTSYPVGRIGHLCGYSDIYFFSKQFKQAAGISPAQFRNAASPEGSRPIPPGTPPTLPSRGTERNEGES